jgi:hypothetical protein
VGDGDSYPVRWRQSTGAEFALNQLTQIIAEPDQVRVSEQLYEQQVSLTINDSHSRWGEEQGQVVPFSFTGLPTARAGVSATLTLDVWANVFNDMLTQQPCITIICIDNAPLRVELAVDGSFSTTLLNTEQPNCAYTQTLLSTSIPGIDALVNADATLEATASVVQDDCFTNAKFQNPSPFIATLSYQAVAAGTMVSVPIYLDNFTSATNWEKLVFEGTEGTTVQVLDLDGELVPDSAIPGNSAGLTAGTQHLFGLSALAYPAIRLRANLTLNSTLSFWEVYANDGYCWRFDHDGDAEGWQVLDDGATPSLNVAGGIARLASTASGTNPRMTYTLPVAASADQFEQAVVRTRTSNNSIDDTVIFYWASNYGGFDAVRSFTASEFLFDYVDVAFDLTQATADPAEPWRGQISALRLDPVASFVDAAGDPSDGWVDIDEICLR